MATNVSTNVQTATAPSKVRLVALGILVVLEGLTLLSVVLHTALLPVPATIYPAVISVLFFLLPLVIGFLCMRFEAAILLAILPFVVLAIIYVAIFAQPWTSDLFSLGVLAYRAASAIVLLGALGAVGWLVRRVFMTASATQAVFMKQ